MKVLFLCTAFNSLSQRLALVLRARGHAVTVELALSPELMSSAAELALPDIIICPFLTKRVPPAVYNRWLTLIVHPGPPGDAGPSALDWTLLGDLGEHETADAELAAIDNAHRSISSKQRMRSHWGVTVLQAIEAFDAGPVWAFDQFKLDEHVSKMTKSDLYRGPVTRAAVKAVLAAVEIVRIVAKQRDSMQVYTPDLQAPDFARTNCVSNGLPFQGGNTHDRPLLKASSRDFFQLTKGNGHLLSADAIVQRIRCGDSQPGVLTSLFGTSFFVYNAVVQTDALPTHIAERARMYGAGTVLATRDGAVLVEVGADYPIWIAYLRRPKAKTDKYLHPKLPGIMALLSVPGCAERLGILSEVEEWKITDEQMSDGTFPWQHRPGTYQQVWVDLEEYGPEQCTIGYIHAEFYNGAFSTTQCEILLSAIKWTLTQPKLKAIVMLGGSGYFSNGIALNVIEGSVDSSAEGWANINAIDDCVQELLAPTGVVTFAAIRGNAAAGGLALATAADVVLCAENAVLNPHYRGIGLYGSEWHTYSWYERCGADVAAKFAREMLPMSSHEACKLGLVDFVIENDKLNTDDLLHQIRLKVRQIMTATAQRTDCHPGAPWTKPLRPVLGQDHLSLPEHMLRNKAKFLAYTFAGQGKDHLSIQEHFSQYRKNELDQMTLDFFHPHRNKRFASRCTAFVRKLIPSSTALRFALHRRHDTEAWHQATGQPLCKDEEELDEFDGLGEHPISVAIPRMPVCRPEYIYRPPSLVEIEVPQSRTTRQDSTISTAPTLFAESRPTSPILSPFTFNTPTIPDSVDSLMSVSIESGKGVEILCSTETELIIGEPCGQCNFKNAMQEPSLDAIVLSDLAEESSDQRMPILWGCYYSETGSKQTIGQLEHTSAKIDNMIRTA